jgi:hypothetical protein
MNAAWPGPEAPVSIAYQLEPDLTPAEFIGILVRSTLAERRPVDRPHVIRAMLDHADIIVTARVDDRLVGVSRAISDFSYCTYLSDLAVDQAYQRQGITSRSYYPHIGMVPHDSCWIIPETQSEP